MGGKWSKLADPETRFWGWVVQGADSECWGWTGSLTEKGYACLTIDRKRQVGSRFSWELHNGPIPAGLIICHRCDNPPCTKPEHLFLGTKSENAADRDLKGRAARGERSARTKFVTQDVLDIRARHAAGESASGLARDYDVRLYSIQQIVHRKTWKHV